MSSLISGADATTHLEILVPALMAATVVIWIGLAAGSSYDANAARITHRPLLLRHSPTPTETRNFEPDQAGKRKYTSNFIMAIYGGSPCRCMQNI